MTEIKKLADEIMEEVEDAKAYAEKYVEHKAAKETEWARRFKEMAEDELKHAKYLHELALAKIEAYSAVYGSSTPVRMAEEWEKTHQKYVEMAAWTRQMLEL
jgi:2-succinyl-5-enolpyruvyl-6-hydroxy-3-cyclohexene-1-carboxylate synthase